MRSNVDKSQVQQAMQKLAAEQAARQEEQRRREKELAAVKVGWRIRGAGQGVYASCNLWLSAQQSL